MWHVGSENTISQGWMQKPSAVLSIKYLAPHNILPHKPMQHEAITIMHRNIHLNSEGLSCNIACASSMPSAWYHAYFPKSYSPQGNLLLHDWFIWVPCTLFSHVCFLTQLNRADSNKTRGLHQSMGSTSNPMFIFLHDLVPMVVYQHPNVY